MKEVHKRFEELFVSQFSVTADVSICFRILGSRRRLMQSEKVVESFFFIPSRVHVYAR
jgi:hypothetical protein